MLKIPNYCFIHIMQVFDSFKRITEKKLYLLHVTYSLPQAPHTSHKRTPSSLIKRPPESPYISPLYSPPSSTSVSSYSVFSPPLATTEIDKIYTLLHSLKQQFTDFQAAINERVNEFDMRLASFEGRFDSHQQVLPSNIEEEVPTKREKEPIREEVSSNVGQLEDHVLDNESIISSIACRVKAMGTRKRKVASSSFMAGERKKHGVKTPSFKVIEVVQLSLQLFHSRNLFVINSYRL